MDPTYVVVEPSDQEINAFLDTALEEAAGPVEPSESSDASAEPTATREARATAPAERGTERATAAATDGDEDDFTELDAALGGGEVEEDDDDGDAAAATVESNELAELRRQRDELLHARDTERAQIRQVVQANQVIQALANKRQAYIDAGDEDGWTKFSNDLVQGYKDKRYQALEGQLNSVMGAIQQTANDEQERDHHVAIIDWFDGKLPNGLTDIERMTCELCATPAELEGAMVRIKELRKSQTQPARDELRRRREATRADQTGLRRTAGVQADTTGDKTYDNYNPELVGDYFDDLLSGVG